MLLQRLRSRQRKINARYLLAILGCTLAAEVGSISSAWAQDGAPKFEVAAIHANPSSDPSQFLIDFSGRQLRATGVSLAALLKFAFEIRDHQIAKGPAWLRSETFDITAGPIAAGSITPQTRQMVQSMLADRFALKVHRETQQQPIYRLVISNAGSKMKEEEANVSLRLRGGPGNLEATASNLAPLITLITNEMGRTVIDGTKLTGRYNFHLQFTPGLATGGDLPSLNTALEEQLGLRLESDRGPVEMVVIDRAEKPSEN